MLHTKISSAKRSLEKNLFLVHPILRQSLLKIREKCVEIILNKRLVQVQQGKSYLLDEFATEQKRYVDDISNGYLVEWQDSLRKLVEEAGIDCLKERGFSPVADVPSAEGPMGEKPVETERGAEQLSESKNSGESMSLSKKLTFTEQAARRTECRRLQRFVKLIDYLIVHSLHVLTVESACDLLKAVFRGCSDADVVVSSQTSQDMMDLQMMEGKSEADESTRFDADASGNNTALSVQLGGIFLGPEVGTKELSDSAYDGFPFILSRIAKEAMFKFNVVDVIEEEGPVAMDAAGAEAEDTFNISSTTNSQLQQQLSNVKKSGMATSNQTSSLSPASKDKSKEKPHVPLFKTELLLGVESMQNILYFAPSLDDFLSLVDNLLKMYLGTVQNVALLTNTIPYLDPANQDGEAGVRDLDDSEFNEGPRVGAIIMEGTFFREVCGRIRGTLLGIYIGATKWMKNYELVRNMWVENDKFDSMKELEAAAGSIAVLLANSNSQHTEGGIAAILNQYAANIANSGTAEDQKKSESMQKNLLLLASTITTAKDGTISSPLVGFFENSLTNFSTQLSSMSAIPLSEVIGNLLVLTDKLKNVLLPSPRRCFDEVSKMLPGIARDKNELLLGEVQTWVRILQSPPQTVEGFVEYLGWLEKGTLSQTSCIITTNWLIPPLLLFQSEIFHDTCGAVLLGSYQTLQFDGCSQDPHSAHRPGSLSNTGSYT